MQNDAARRCVCILHLAFCIALSGCAPKRLALPTDLVTPLPDVQQVHQQVTRACRAIRTLTAELSLSGRAGDERLRGRVIAGFAQPASMRLEGVAPFGQPVFILVTTGGRNSTLLLPRDARVVRGETAEDILGALTGVTLGPADLQAVLTGCVTAAAPSGGYKHRNGWASIVFPGGATMYLQPRGQGWELRAAKLGDWQIEYVAGTGTLPASVTLHADMPVRVDLRADISQVEANVDLDANAFTVTVPREAQPLALDVLRANGPLRESR
jgi:outer membrane lipoprotein-sorting protein